MADTIDQQNTTGSIGVGFGDTGSGRDYTAQSFIPTVSNITAVSFQLTSVGSVGMKIWIDNVDASFFPTGAVGVGIGGETEIPVGSLSASFAKYQLATLVTLIPGNRYAFVLAPWNTTTHAWTTGFRDLVSSTANPYTSGRRTQANGSYVFNTPDSGNLDMLFRTWHDPDLIRGAGKKLLLLD